MPCFTVVKNFGGMLRSTMGDELMMHGSGKTRKVLLNRLRLL